MSPTSRVVTLAQLCLLPRGTLLACVKFDDAGQVVHDCQGVVQVGPLHRLRSVSESWVTIVPVLPDIRWYEGRLDESYAETMIARPAFCDHRFIIYDEGVIRFSPIRRRYTWRP